MKIHIRPLEEGGTGIPTAEEVLRAYATARGFSTQGLGQPDESRAARFVLKDYVKGKLLFCHPPPSDPPIDPQAFNKDLYDEAHLPQKRRAALAAHMEALVTGSEDPSLIDDPEMIPLPPIQGEKSNRLDKKFFSRGQGNGQLTMPFHYQYSEQGQSAGKQLTGRKARELLALEKDVEPSELKMSSKKHFKGNKRRVKAKNTGEFD
jgi:large subunit GTPase 1